MQGVELSQELTEVRGKLEDIVQLLGRVPSPLLEQDPPTHPVVDSVQALEDCLSQKQWSAAVQLLRGFRCDRVAVGAYIISIVLQEAAQRGGNIWRLRR